MMKKIANRLVFRNRGKVFFTGFIKFQKKTETLADALVSEPSMAYSASLLWKEETISSPKGNAYQQQIRSFQTQEEMYRHNQAEQQANQNMAIAMTSACLAVIGFVYPAANLFSLLGILHINYVAFKSAYKSIMNQGKLNVDVLCISMLPMIIVQRYFFLMSLTSLIYAGYHRVLLIIKNNTTKKTIDVFKDQPRRVWVPAESAHLSEIDVVEVSLNSL